MGSKLPDDVKWSEEAAALLEETDKSSPKSIAKTTNPEWKEKRTLRVPLDREFEAERKAVEDAKGGLSDGNHWSG